MEDSAGAIRGSAAGGDPDGVGSPPPSDGPQGGDEVLRVEELRVRFVSDGRVVRAVDGISFTIRPGELLGLVGESGSGKSVTGLTLMGLVRDIGGEVSGRALLAGSLDLVTASAPDLQKVRGSRIAMIFQDPLSSLNPFHRVGDQIAEAILAHQDVSRGWARGRAEELLGEVGIPQPARRAGDFPHEFSGGMRQRVMIAIALANEPDLLIADEPTTALDVTTQSQILDLITRLRDEHGMAVLLISHDLGVIAERTHRVVVMKDGQAVERGDVASVFGNPSAAYTRQLLDAVPRLDLPRELGASERAATPLVEATDLEFSYPARRGLWRRPNENLLAVGGVSLEVEAGRTLGIVGESGSGKSTLCRLIVRLLDPDAGSVRFAGQEITGLSAREMRRVRASMQMIFQNPFSSLNPRHRVGSILAAPMRLHTDLRGSDLERQVGRLLERVGLSAADRDRYPHEFSGGQRQRIAIARALGPSPRLVVADEPVSSLDVTVQAQILALLRELQEDLGLTLIVVSHDLGVIGQIADRVVVMREGKVIETGSATQICTAPLDPYTRRLLDAVPRLPV